MWWTKQSVRMDKHCTTWLAEKTRTRPQPTRQYIILLGANWFMNVLERTKEDRTNTWGQKYASKIYFLKGDSWLFLWIADELWRQIVSGRTLRGFVAGFWNMHEFFFRKKPNLKIFHSNCSICLDFMETATSRTYPRNYFKNSNINEELEEFPENTSISKKN